ncbi:MAG: GH32 C-terminal domain-containing protein [Tannerellaceae bacterium]|nr:GH32 C-terminal domain-containing protein [Tannerellaceae bacterium]
MKTIYNMVIFLLAIHTTCFGQATANKWNPSYHFYPSGDPTGLFYLDGRYFNNWGSAASTDFVHWQFTSQRKNSMQARQLLRDPAISESIKDSLRRQMVRLGGSGSIILDHNNASGLGKNGHPPLLSFWHNEARPFRTQGIGLAYSNDTATTWTRYEKYPILDINSREFRDPKVFRHEKTGKWIMAIGWAEVPKILFFRSDNLIDWELMSEFGPWGATNGVWECVELFPVAVDDNPDNIKWLMVHSVQPFNGQYFVGEFDGERFVMDPDFVQQYTFEQYRPEGDILFNFEQGIDDWKMEGNAFVQSPSSQALYRQGAIMGKEGKFFLNSFHKEMTSTGQITSPEFTISQDFINFKIGGGYAPNKESVNLLINDRIVRSETGRNSNNLQWASWDVTEYRGQKAQIKVIDDMVDGYGCIYADHFVLSNKAADTTDLEKSFWIDYGPDFFAVRAWNNYAPQEKRNIWTAWMSSWRYTGEEPVGGIQSIPREVKLKTFPEGIRLIQQPVKELQSLRKKQMKTIAHTFDGLWIPVGIKPASNAYELIVEFENVDAKEFGLKLCVGNKEKTIVGYNVDTEELYVDRRDSGFDEFIGLFPKINKGPLKNRYGKVKLHIFVDNCSIEVFANDGETTISSKIYPDPASTGIEFFAGKGQVKVTSANLYELDSIHLHDDLK